MAARSIAEQTGWGRPHPQTMLQGFPNSLELLLQVTETDFDLEDPGFRFYCQQRGIADLFSWAARETAGDDTTDAKIIRLAKGRLQDAWEMYCSPGAAEIMRKWVRPGVHDPYHGSPAWEPPIRQQAVPPVAPTHTVTAQELIAWATRLGFELEREGQHINLIASPDKRSDECRECIQAIKANSRAVLAALPDTLAAPVEPVTEPAAQTAPQASPGFTLEDGGTNGIYRVWTCEGDSVLMLPDGQGGFSLYHPGHADRRKKIGAEPSVEAAIRRAEQFLQNLKRPIALDAATEPIPTFTPRVEKTGQLAFDF
jgi:hypothetical protein